MKLESLYIEEFKNLRDFSVTFDTDSLTSVILGRNGTGKSNLLEALILIFRDLDLGESPQFGYRMVYFWHEYEVSIDADPARPRREQVQVKLDGWEITYQEFRQYPERRYLPKYVFGYYSGPSNRMESHFEAHQQRFYRDLLRGVENPLRPLLYARLVHSQFALLSFFNEEDEDILKFLKDTLGIEELISVLFVLREPPWTSREGDPRFWNARGVVQRFLSELYRLALMPLRLKQRVSLEFQSSTTLEHLYLYLKDAASLKELASHYPSQQEFFKALESTYISKILSEVRIRIKIRKADGSLTFRDLSEGEQQLLMVLGLLRFTKEDEALFLLDEPDTHLNPAWSIQYIEFLKMVVGDQPTSQIIMSTHNPLVISDIDRQQVRIMQHNEETGHVYVEKPEENPTELSVDSILTSDLFGLRSAVGMSLQRLIDERRSLAVKEHLDQQELTRLGELNELLAGTDFSTGVPDSDYARFIRKKIARENAQLRQQVVLTPQQLRDQDDLIDEIMDELEAEEQEHDTY